MKAITIFTDGSSRGNPGPGGWGAIVIYADEGANKNENQEADQNSMVKELGGSEKLTTNNRMEMTAVIEALLYIDDFSKDSEIIINTDSSYVINGATKWLAGWQRKNWISSQKEEVLNRDLWEKIASLIVDKKIIWKHVGGHVGIAGNERCDQIATAFADGTPTDLYDGQISAYKIDIFDHTVDSSKSATRASQKSRSRAKAYSYLSCVDGKIERHATWAECEARVKGKSGTRYKKTLNAEDEKSSIAEW